MYLGAEEKRRSSRNTVSRILILDRLNLRLRYFLSVLLI